MQESGSRAELSNVLKHHFPRWPTRTPFYYLINQPINRSIAVAFSSHPSIFQPAVRTRSAFYDEHTDPQRSLSIGHIKAGDVKGVAGVGSHLCGKRDVVGNFQCRDELFVQI